MAEVARHAAPFSYAHEQEPSMGAPLYGMAAGSNEGPVDLLPNPDFVFPLPAPDSSDSASRAGSQRPMSSQYLGPPRRAHGGISQRRSVGALPSFSFNPAASGSDATPSTTSPTTPTTPPSLPDGIPTTPSRNVGHRRGGSEFIGGDGRFGSVGLMSTSPTKGDGILPPPTNTLKVGPPAGRRGHAHRRSGAISCHDLQTIMHPPEAISKARGGSAPTTPLETENKQFFHPNNRRTLSQSSLKADGNADGTESAQSSPQRPVSRARVGFSERVEYIRPLSTISSETESSMSTIRGHSVSGSMSSVISASASSPPSARKVRTPLRTTFEDESAKPRRSSAETTSWNNLGDDLDLQQRPRSAVAPGSAACSPVDASPVKYRSTKKRHSFWPEQRRSTSFPPSPLPASRSDSSLVAKRPHSPQPAQETDNSMGSPSDTSSPEEKQSRRPRKVKSWAHSLISRKSRSSFQKTKASASDVSPLPTPLGSNILDDLSPFDDPSILEHFDVDDTVDIVTSSPVHIHRPQLNTRIASWKPRDSSPQADALSPVIDLDAALGPFNTPGLNARSPPGRTLASARRSMHSNILATGILGVPEHRRTESAPELAPFEARGSALAGTKMADVFEEEEEEEEARSALNKASPATPQSGTGNTQVHGHAKQESDASVPEFSLTDENVSVDVGLGIKGSDDPGESKSKEADGSHLSPAGQGTPTPSRGSSPYPRDPSPIDVVEDFEEPRASSLTKDSDSTLTPTVTAQDPKEPAPLMTLGLPRAHQSYMTPDTYTSSSFSSPDFNRSQISFDDSQRVRTAGSSVVEEASMPAYPLGEPGPELRVSVDDVPSLTSSRSTMTSPPHTSVLPSHRGLSDTRSSSLCSIPNAYNNERRPNQKRSSIASLSKLMSGTFGERSKLSIEQRPQTEHGLPQVEKLKSNKRQNRLSKLMFWKNKESSRS
ncbi:hypothetical protein K402DRAFT_152924 [Aulographum hederae CBS 113979]|uniref:Cell wall proline rich protein n=1 Tax=Aulographum hederae CBS 113979 TaxID=1176131 RepID=A0A6G1GT77_9PEZI|nr:hypothetical protein K402DRAFT_152924 [Aulographum hederae CBS 113979]